MIGWTDINPVLIEIFTEAAIDSTRLSEGFTAEWKEGPVGIVHTGQSLALQLKVTRVSAIGEDETRRSEATVDGLLVVTESQSGQRKFTLQVQAIVPAHTDDQWSMATLERVRMRLRRPRIIDRLLDLDVALIRIDDAVKASIKDRGRVVSVSVMDVVFGAVAHEDDPVPMGWVQYLVISSHLKEGTELEPALQLVSAEVPTIPTIP
jgi:hypothetical protein